MVDEPKRNPKNPTVAEWAKLAESELKGADASSLDWLTPEGLKVKPLYTAADLEGLETLDGPLGGATSVAINAIAANTPITISRVRRGKAVHDLFMWSLLGDSGHSVPKFAESEKLLDSPR